VIATANGELGSGISGTWGIAWARLFSFQSNSGYSAGADTCNIFSKPRPLPRFLQVSFVFSRQKTAPLHVPLETTFLHLMDDAALTPAPPHIAERHMFFHIRLRGW
jgi:hypothetical protein